MNRRGRISVTLAVDLPLCTGEKGKADPGEAIGLAGVNDHC